MAKHRLTDRKLSALKAGATRYEVMDTDVPGFGVRVSETGQRTFILIHRYPGSRNPTRRALGEYPAISLEKARRRARDWRDLIEKGVDPKAHEASLKREELRFGRGLGLYVDELIALTGDYRVARAAFDAAVKRRPGRIVTLRQKTRLLADSRRKN